MLRLMDATPVPCGQSVVTAKRSDLYGWAGYGYCASFAANTSGIERASFIESLVNVVWQVSTTLATNVQVNDNLTASQALPSASDLQGDLASPATFEELFSDFVALTLHSRANATATGNDPDCRQEDKEHDGLTPAGPTGSDPSFTVQHIKPSGSADYSYPTQALGGARTDGGNTSGEISDPGVIDWSLTRDTGPDAPRVAPTGRCPRSPTECQARRGPGTCWIPRRPITRRPAPGTSPSTGPTVRSARPRA
jgi:hypothetical protein